MFFGCSHSIWKFPGQGSNLHHSKDPSHSSDNAGSLNRCTTENIILWHFKIKIVLERSSHGGVTGSAVSLEHWVAGSTPSLAQQFKVSTTAAQIWSLAQELHMLYGSFPPKKNILRERYPILIQPLPSKEPSIAEKKKGKRLHRIKNKNNFFSWGASGVARALRNTVWKQIKEQEAKGKAALGQSKSVWLVTCWPCSLCWSCILSCLGVFVLGLMMLALGCIPWRGKLPCWFIWFIIELNDGDCPWRLKPPCIGGPCAGYVCPYNAAFCSIITAASWPWKASCLGSKACP